MHIWWITISHLNCKAFFRPYVFTTNRSWRLPRKRNTIYSNLAEKVLTWKRVINTLYSNSSFKIIKSGLPRTVIIWFILFCIWGQSLKVSTQGIVYRATIYGTFRCSLWRRSILSVFETDMSGIIIHSRRTLGCCVELHMGLFWEQFWPS